MVQKKMTEISNNTLDPSSVDLITRNQWCNQQLSSCPRLCSDGGTQTFDDTCSASTLQYVCTCSNGIEPLNIAEYKGTLPNSICEQIFADCRIANPGSESCKSCGSLNVPTTTIETLFPSSTSSTISSSFAATILSFASPASPSPPASGTTATSSRSSTTPSNVSLGLPSSVRTGIGVGVPFGFIIFAGITFLAYRFGQRKANQRTEAKRKSYQNAADEQQPEPGGDTDTWVGYVPEIHGTEIPQYSRELEGSQPFHELEGSLGQRRQELA